jgi:Pentapeptide repeats (8 copies)
LDRRNDEILDIHLFFHYIVEGKYKDTDDHNWRESYNNEKKLLRIISVLKQLHGENLTWKLVTQELKKFESTIDTPCLEPISRAASYFFYFKSTTAGKKIDFVHKASKEYLLAEYYLESLLKNKIHRLNIGMPTKETILFLDGLIDLILESAKDNSIWQQIDQEETSLLQSFGYHKGIGKALEELEDNALKCVEHESIVFVNDNVKNSEETEKVWESLDISNNYYEHLWIHRWISLYIFNKLKSKKELNKDRLISLIKLSSIVIPGYIKNLRKVDLSGIEISHVRLDEATLTEANLSAANLSAANLSDSNLVNSDLSAANLSSANLLDAVLFRANLSYAHMYGIMLLRANLSYSNLSHANLFYADLSHA